MKTPIASRLDRCRRFFALAGFLMITLGLLPAASAASWCYTPWSWCEPICVSTRSATCATDSSCTVFQDEAVCLGALGAPEVTQNCFGNECLSDWISGAWSACSTTCGTGTQTSTVTCRSGETVMVDDQCNPATKPDSIISCTSWECTFVWNTGAWSACSVPCGDGTQARSVSCVALELGTVVADGYCDPGTRPAASLGCVGGSCAYAWEVGAWSACDVPCGEGEKDRTVVCREAFTGELVADGLCTEARPAVTETCDGTGCAYAWEPGAWGDCPAACGPGIQERAFECVEAYTGEVVAEIWCVEAEPAEVRLCEGTACTHEWRTSGWSECSAACGGGFASRATWCVEVETGVLVEPGLCDGASEPLSTMICNDQACPETHTWAAGDWGPCSAGCVDENPGVRTRELYCIDGGFAFVDPSLCDPLLAPEATEACESVQECTPVAPKKDGGCSVSARGPSTPSVPLTGTLLMLLFTLTVLFPRKR